MADHYFLSYSSVEAGDFALALADALKAERPNYDLWVDKRRIQQGRTPWDSQIAEAIRDCRGLLFAMTADSVRDESVCHNEWFWALKYKKPVIPLQLERDADTPFLLGLRQTIDFTGDFDTGLATLRNHLRWTATPEGKLQETRNRLGDAERELRRVSPTQEPLVRQEIDELRRQVEEQRRLVENPQAAREDAEARIATALERERQPERPAVAEPRTKFVNPPPMTAPPYFQDRDDETRLVAEFVRADGPRLISVVGRGGVGKTAMVCRLLKSLQAGRLPGDLGELEIDGIVYLSPVGPHGVSFRNLFADLCRLLPPEKAEPLLDRYREPQATPDQLMRSLLEEFPTGRVVVLLDNFEDLIDAETLAIADEELDEALRALLTAAEHAVKVILTSRLPPRALLAVQPGVQQHVDLERGLPSPHAENILRELDRDGSLGLRDADDALLRLARERTRGFPRALELLAGILVGDRDTTLQELLADAEQMPDNVVEALVGEAFNRLDPLAQQVMHALAIYREPVPAVAVDYLLQPFRPVDSQPVLSRLVNMRFVRRDAGRYYLHQVDLDYALQRIVEGEPSDRVLDPLPFTQHALHDRAADYFEETRTPRETWRTLDDLAPQLAEFDMRCAAGDDEAAAVLLGDIGFDYLMLWGHFRLLIDLRKRLEGRLVDPTTAMENKHELGNALYLSGDLRGAASLFQKVLEIARDEEDRGWEAAALGSLALAYSDLDEAARAVDLYEEALVIIRELGDRQMEGAALGNLSSIYASRGEIQRALDLSNEVLAIVREVADRQVEVNTLAGIASSHHALGDRQRAIEVGELALSLAREIGYRRGEAIVLKYIGGFYESGGDRRIAGERYTEALDIADADGLAQGRSEIRIALAGMHLEAGDAQAAAEAAAAALEIGYAPAVAGASLFLGIALLLQGDGPAGARAFEDALGAFDAVLGGNPADVGALDSRAFAYCGLALIESPKHVADARASFEAARALTDAKGYVADLLRLFDVIARADDAGVLAPLRTVAAGEGAGAAVPGDR